MLEETITNVKNHCFYNCNIFFKYRLSITLFTHCCVTRKTIIYNRNNFVTILINTQTVPIQNHISWSKLQENVVFIFKTSKKNVYVLVEEFLIKKLTLY